jgi:NADH:ubiquinone oxidoreductase subunit H
MGLSIGASQTLGSYEIAMGLSIITFVSYTNTLSFKEIAEQRRETQTVLF